MGTPSPIVQFANSPVIAIVLHCNFIQGKKIIFYDGIYVVASPAKSMVDDYGEILGMSFKYNTNRIGACSNIFI